MLEISAVFNSFIRRSGRRQIQIQFAAPFFNLGWHVTFRNSATGYLSIMYDKPVFLMH